MGARANGKGERIYFTEVEVAEHVFWKMVRKKYINQTGAKLSDVKKVKVTYRSARAGQYTYLDGKLYTKNRIN